MEPLPPVGHSTEFARALTHDDVAAFADLVGDHNPLYTSSEFGARTPYGRRLVHGALLVGLVNAALTDLTGPGYVLLGQETRFSAAVGIGEEVTVSAKVLRVREDKRIVSAETLVVRPDGETAFRGVGGLMQMEQLRG